MKHHSTDQRQSKENQNRRTKVHSPSHSIGYTMLHYVALCYTCHHVSSLLFALHTLLIPPLIPFAWTVVLARWVCNSWVARIEFDVFVVPWLQPRLQLFTCPNMNSMLSSHWSLGSYVARVGQHLMRMAIWPSSLAMFLVVMRGNQIFQSSRPFLSKLIMQHKRRM